MKSKKHKILIVDDERFYINVLLETLSPDYQIMIAKDGKQALTHALQQPDLILLDIVMPNTDGYEVCRQLKNNPKTHEIPVIFLTIRNEAGDEVRGFELGAVDYIGKPISPEIVKKRVANHIALSDANRSLKKQNDILEHTVTERTSEICHAQDVTIYCLTSLVETRDNETGFHIRRTQNYVFTLANYLMKTPPFNKTLNHDYNKQLFKSAPLHDIGKVGVADKILLKQGKLEGEEWEEMKRHTIYGKQAIDRAESEMGRTPFLDIAKEIAYTHHEKWDGSGYPQGLKGDNIPLSGRLMAIADVYDALISPRVYKPAFTHEAAVELIKENSGTHFDPQIVKAFLSLENQFNKIAREFVDLVE